MLLRGRIYWIFKNFQRISLGAIQAHEYGEMSTGGIVMMILLLLIIGNIAGAVFCQKKKGK